MSNLDSRELAKFERAGGAWWGEQGEYRTLRDITPARSAFVADQAALRGRALLDVGCGGGILSEALAARGAVVTGIDLAATAIAAAREHAGEAGLAIDYRVVSAEQLAEEAPARFDVLTCMELLEHLPDPAALVAACVRLVRPGGWLFFGTLNRTPEAYALAVVAAEYVLKLLPRGTHDYARFIRPAELAAWLRGAGAEVVRIQGLAYNPLTRQARLTDRPAVNYLLSARTPPDAP